MLNKIIAIFLLVAAFPAYAGLSSGGSGVSSQNPGSVPSYTSIGTKFTTSGGGCTVTGTTGGATAGSFTTSTTGTCTTTITMNGATGLTAPDGWSCYVSDITSGVAGAQDGVSTTTAVLKITTSASDVVTFGCFGY